MKKAERKLDRDLLERVAKLFRAFGDATRLAILQELKNGGERSVGELVERVGGSQGNVSRQLQILFDAGLLGRSKIGNQVFYSVCDEVVSDLCELVCDKLNRDAKGSSAPDFAI